MKQKRLILIIILILCVSIINVYSETIEALSCSRTDVQTAINSANDGDTVLIPAGNCTWTEAVVIDPMPAITILGSGIDNTIIVDSTGSTWMQCPFWIEGVEGKPFRISGITFTGNLGTFAAITIRGNCKNWRVDHCEFDSPNATGRGLAVGGNGVIDHCIFRDCVQGLSVAGNGDTAWTEPLALGTSKAVYIEDCVFDYTAHLDGSLDAYDGARYVFRHNTQTNTGAGHHGLDTSPGYRSPVSCEVYNNYTLYTINNFQAYGTRGGTSVVFNNTVDVAEGMNVYHFYRISYYRSCSDSYMYTNIFGRCDATPECILDPGTLNTIWDETLQQNILDVNTPGAECILDPVTGQPLYDGNLDGTGYPCLDQPGRSGDIDGDGIQELEPLYEWNNILDGTDADFTLHYPADCSNPSMTDHLQEGRDYFNDTFRPDYVPYPYPHPLTGGELLDLSASDFENEVLLSWNSINGAADYVVYRNWEELGNTSSNSYTDNTVQSDEAYIYYVKALNSSDIIIAAEGTKVREIVNNNDMVKQDFIIYPNPSSSILFIESNTDNELFIELISITGVKVLQQKINTTLYQIDISNLPEGVYLYRIFKDITYIKNDKLIIKK